MKKFGLVIVVLFLFVNQYASSEKTADDNPCNNMYVDLENGTLNGLNGSESMDEVKTMFPCFTGESEENEDGINCGGGIFFLDHDLFFYTQKDYINLRKNFLGETSSAILGVTATDAMNLFGEPNVTSTYVDDWLDETSIYMQYEKKWGTLVLIAQDGVIIELELHYGKKPSEIEFCL